MEPTSGILYGFEERIKTKLIAIGATSKEKAVTKKQANFSIQEENWINYIAGGLFARVKKTKDGKLYAPIYS
jgi:hypothetical protein